MQVMVVRGLKARTMGHSPFSASIPPPMRRVVFGARQPMMYGRLQRRSNGPGVRVRALQTWNKRSLDNFP